jgi:hypothetical protein
VTQRSEGDRFEGQIRSSFLLSNGSNSFIYSPDDTPIEQINTENHVQYLPPRRDQQKRANPPLAFHTRRCDA